MDCPSHHILTTNALLKEMCFNLVIGATEALGPRPLLSILGFPSTLSPL